MLRPSDKHWIKRIIFGKVGLIVVLIFFVLSGKAMWGVYQKAQFAKENREQSEAELVSLQEREAVLKEELSRINSDRGLEEEIRQKFDVGREGEHLIVLVDAPDPVDTGVEEKPSLWQRFIGLFGF